MHGHDNSTNHPPLDRCLKTIDLMYEYVDVYQQYKKSWLQSVVLNVYGGESLFHPNIVEILEQARERHKKYNWNLTITCTTNLVVGSNLLHRIVDLVDEFTVSIHSEALPKQQQQTLDNLLYLKEKNKRVKAIIVMHNDPKYWDICLELADFCRTHNISHFTKALDNTEPEWSYNQEQQTYFKMYRLNQTVDKSKDRLKNLMDSSTHSSSVNSIKTGRSCCAGRCLSTNNNLKESIAFVPKQGFKDWYCTVNWYFLYISQLTELVYHNKDCQMTFDDTVGPLCTLDDLPSHIKNLRENLALNTLPTIKCIKNICLCGICAPKADSIESLDKMMKNYVVPSITFDKL
jgi:hypothetical protein